MISLRKSYVPFLFATSTILLPFEWGVAQESPSKYGEFAPADAFQDSELAYYGSENEWSRRQFSKSKADEAYKRRGQRQMLAIIDGDAEQGLQWAQQRLEADPDDIESMFTRTAAYCRLGALDLAIVSAKEAVEKGLPIERFQAGPRWVFQPLTELAAFQEFAASRTTGLIHGPMLGCVTDNSAKVWVRVEKAGPVAVKVFSCDQNGKPTNEVITTADATAVPARDYTAIIQLTGLEPDTEYAYDVQISGSSVLRNELPRLKTFPSIGSEGKLKVAFGGGAGFSPINERMWDTIAISKPDALLLLGDNVYIDLPEEPRGLHRYTYYRRQSRPEFRRLVATTPVYAIWDDHDCALDDVWMGPYLDRPHWKPSMLTVFKENWVNPDYGNEQAPGCWFATSLAGIDFFFLDTRYWRTNPHGEHPTMLGPIQKEWLLKKIKHSKSEFKVLVSSVPWAPNSKPGSRDTWDGFREEREEIFNWIESNEIEGVLLLSADRHRSDVRRIVRPNGYALYDMMSSRLTNMHVHECLPDSLFCYNASCSFGLLTLDLTAADPTATFDVVNIDGETIHTLELTRSQLGFPNQR